MSNFNPKHPWRTWQPRGTTPPPARPERHNTDADDFRGTCGQPLNDRAFGARLREGFAEMNSSYDEKGNK